MLGNIQEKFGNSSVNRDQTLEKFKRRHSIHIEKVNEKMVAAQLAELDRIEDKLNRTTEKKVNFLQRLELNEKEKAEDHSSMMMERKQHWDDIRYR